MPANSACTMALLTGWGISSGLTGVMWMANNVTAGTIDVVGVIPPWALLTAWGLSTIAMFFAGIAAGYKKIAEGRARIMEAERDACTGPLDCKYEDFHKQRLCD